MEAVLTRPRQSYIFDRALTKEEIDELVDNYDYDPAYDHDEGREPEPMFDMYGNPTRDTIASMYEMRFGIHSHPMTLEEFDDELDKWRAEADAEMTDEAD